MSHRRAIVLSSVRKQEAGRRAPRRPRFLGYRRAAVKGAAAAEETRPPSINSVISISYIGMSGLGWRQEPGQQVLGRLGRVELAGGHLHLIVRQALGDLGV